MEITNDRCYIHDCNVKTRFIKMKLVKHCRPYKYTNGVEVKSI